MDRQAGEVLRNSRMQSTVRKEGHMFKMEFKTDTAAFSEYLMEETAHCLKKVAFRLEFDGVKSGAVKDINGNTIGHFELTED